MKDWTSVAPPWETQYSIPNHLDAQDCTSESFVHIVEMLQGNTMRYSPRALAKMSGNTPNGNTWGNVINAACLYGLIPYALWPTPDTFTWAEYYADIPAEIQKQAVRVIAQTIPPNLNESPLWTILQFPTTTHSVAQINQTQYFDSETGAPIKTIAQPIVVQASIKLLPNKMQPIYQLQGQPALYFAVGSVLIPFATDFTLYQQTFATNPIIQLTQGQFEQFSVAPNLAVKSL